MHGVRNFQYALVDHECHTGRPFRADLDRESGGVLSAVFGGLAPSPDVVEAVRVRRIAVIAEPAPANNCPGVM